jgi:hypothetical protein
LLQHTPIFAKPVSNDKRKNYDKLVSVDLAGKKYKKTVRRTEQGKQKELSKRAFSRVFVRKSNNRKVKKLLGYRFERILCHIKYGFEF